MLFELALELCVQFLLECLVDLIAEVPLVQCLNESIHTFAIFAACVVCQEQGLLIFEPPHAIEFLELSVVNTRVLFTRQVHIKCERLWR